MEMNGRKILERLILLFIGINLILFIFISIRRGTQYQLSQTRINNIVGLLTEGGITLEAELPKEFAPKMSATLSYTGDNVAVRSNLVKVFWGNDLSKVSRSTENSKEHFASKVYYFNKEDERLAFDKEEITYTNTGVNLLGIKPSITEAKAKAEAFIKRLGVGKLYKNAYFEIKEEENSVIITYFPIFEYIPIFDLPIEMKVYENGIGSATIYLGEVNAANGKKQRITPIDLVLFGIEEYIPLEGNIVIKDITLGYKRLEKKGSNLWGEEIVPMYKIEVDGLEKPLFVNAYTNEIVK